MPLLYLVLPAYILGNMFSQQTTEAVAGLGFITLGAGVYFGMGLQKTEIGGQKSEVSDHKSDF